MKVREVIDRLKVGDTVWVKGKVSDTDKSDPLLYVCIGGTGYKWLGNGEEISLTEPKSDKVEVPSMIDKFIKDHTDPIFEICEWYDLYGNVGRTCDDPELSVVLDWYGNNTTEFYEAVVNGYTVEQPKQWVVRQGGYLQGFRNSLDGDIVKQWGIYEDCIKFTDKSKAEAVATLVEGSVEEV